MSWGSGFEELGDRLDELAERFEVQREQRQPQNPDDNYKFVKAEGRFDPKNRIASGVSRAMRESGGVVDTARSDAKRYVPAADADTIGHQQVSWNEHYLTATSDLVKYHEFGTSTRASDPSQATVNAPNRGGYVIPIQGYDNLPFGPDSLPEEMDFKFVVHPGVEGQHFMRNALERNVWKIEERVADELDDLNLDL